MYHAGFDYFSPEAGEHESVKCKACLCLMDVERGVLRTKGRYGILTEPRKEDIFTCPNAGKDWHSQIIALIREKDRTPSTLLANLYEEEIVDIRKRKKKTKDWTGF